MKQFVFNASMPRSGSELFQCIVNQNPRIYGSVTSPLLEYQFGARTNYDLPEVKSQDGKLMQEAFLSMNKSMAEGYYNAITDKPIVCDKNRGWTHYYEWVEQWLGEQPKMICLVRDLRSIVASMERIYENNRHSPQGIDNPAKIENMTVSQRVNHWLHSQPVGLALQRTLDLFERGVNDKILFIRYEDLCNDPATEMQKFYSYIGEESYQHDFNKIEKNIVEDDSFFGIFGNHSVKSSITKPKNADWSDVLNEDIAEGIRNFAKWYSKVFKY